MPSIVIESSRFEPRGHENQSLTERSTILNTKGKVKTSESPKMKMVLFGCKVFVAAFT